MAEGLCKVHIELQMVQRAYDGVFSESESDKPISNRVYFPALLVNSEAEDLITARVSSYTALFMPHARGKIKCPHSSAPLINARTRWASPA